MGLTVEASLYLSEFLKGHFRNRLVLETRRIGILFLQANILFSLNLLNHLPPNPACRRNFACCFHLGEVMSTLKQSNPAAPTAPHRTAPRRPKARPHPPATPPNSASTPNPSSSSAKTPPNSTPSPNATTRPVAPTTRPSSPPSSAPSGSWSA